MKVDIQELTNTLTQYEEGGLCSVGKGYLKDDLLALSHQLYMEGVREGQEYEAITVVVEKEKPFPSLHEPTKHINIATGDEMEISIHEIVSLQRTPKGDIAMEVLASVI